MKYKYKRISCLGGPVLLLCRIVKIFQPNDPEFVIGILPEVMYMYMLKYQGRN